MSDGATVDPSSLIVTFGSHVLRGKAKGTFVTASRDEDAFALNMGIDGEGFWIKNSSLAGTVTIVLQQSSQSNDQLSFDHLADLSVPGGLMKPLAIKEPNGTTVAFAARARIVKSADATWSDGGEVRTWTIRTSRLDINVGGLIATPIAE